MAPKPKLKKKIRTPAFETNISYKVVVWTANVADAGTDATVSPMESEAMCSSISYGSLING